MGSRYLITGTQLGILKGMCESEICTKRAEETLKQLLNTIDGQYIGESENNINEDISYCRTTNKEFINEIKKPPIKLYANAVFDYKPADIKHHNEMKDIYHLCSRNEIPVPELVKKYFNNKSPEIYEIHESELNSITEWEGDENYHIRGYKGIQIDISKIPYSAKYIRVFYKENLK